MKRVSDAVMRAVKGLETQYTHSIVTLVSAAGDFLYMSNEGVLRNGYARDEALGRSFRDFVHPDDVKRIFESMQEALISGKSRVMRLQVRQRDGSYQTLQGFSVKLVDEATGEFFLANVTQPIPDQPDK